MADQLPLPQEFPRELALLRLADVAPELAPGVREAFTAAFEHRRAQPLDPRGLVLVGPSGLRPLIALMRLMVLRLRDLNFERFAAHGGKERLLSAYCLGENLPSPLPERAAALFIERADRVALAGPALAASLPPGVPVFATWEGPEAGLVWDVLVSHCDVIRL